LALVANSFSWYYIEVNEKPKLSQCETKSKIKKFVAFPPARAMGDSAPERATMMSAFQKGFMLTSYADVNNSVDSNPFNPEGSFNGYCMIAVRGAGSARSVSCAIVVLPHT
jgi:phosphoribosylformylglycinamidine (FGAM) synthase-like amidotransferase family enzyme